MSLKCSVITIHPQLIESIASFGTFKRARGLGLTEIQAVDLRDYAVDRHGSVDDRPYGGGEGMVLRPEPLAAAVKALRATDPQAKVIYLSPGGDYWHQRHAEVHLGEGLSLIFVCGRFAGVDQRFIDLYVDYQYSVGDMILAGGELPAMIMIESMIRLIPGALGHEESAVLESFSESFDYGLEHPLYTRPPVFENQEVPPVLMGGNHGEIAKWRRQSSQERTLKSYKDLSPSGRSRRFREP